MVRLGRVEIELQFGADQTSSRKPLMEEVHNNCGIQPSDTQSNLQPYTSFNNLLPTNTVLFISSRSETGASVRRTQTSRSELQPPLSAARDTLLSPWEGKRSEIQWMNAAYWSGHTATTTLENEEIARTILKELNRGIGFLFAVFASGPRVRWHRRFLVKRAPVEKDVTEI